MKKRNDYQPLLQHEDRLIRNMMKFPEPFGGYTFKYQIWMLGHLCRSIAEDMIKDAVKDPETNLATRRVGEYFKKMGEFLAEVEEDMEELNTEFFDCRGREIAERSLVFDVEEPIFNTLQGKAKKG